LYRKKTAVMKVGKNNIARTSASPTDYHVLSIRINCSQGPLNYLAFQSFDYQRTRWRLFQEPVSRTNLDIYDFITHK